MNKYTIHYDYYATYDVEVLAESKEEAIKKAREIEVPYEEYDFSINEESVINTEEVPDLSILISQAESIIKNADEEDKPITLDPWLNVTTEYWTGEKMEHKTDLMDNIYWNYEDDEIGFNTVNSAGDFDLSELPEIEQYQLCQAIIAQNRKEVCHG